MGVGQGLDFVEVVLRCNFADDHASADAAEAAVAVLVQVGHVILGRHRAIAAADDCVAVLEELCAMCGVRSGVRGAFCGLCGVRVCVLGECVRVGEEVVDGDGVQVVRRRALSCLSFMSADAWRVHSLQPLRAPKAAVVLSFRVERERLWECFLSYEARSARASSHRKANFQSFEKKRKEKNAVFRSSLFFGFHYFFQPSREEWVKKMIGGAAGITCVHFVDMTRAASEA